MPVDPSKVRELHALNLGRGLLACRLTPDGTRAIASGMNGQVTRCAIADGKLTDPKHGPGHETWTASLAFQPEGKRFFAADYGGVVACHDIEKLEQPVWSQAAHQGWIRSVAASPDGRTVATAGNDRAVRLWNAAEGSAIRELGTHADHVYSILFHPGGERLVSADLKGIVKEWDVAGGKLVREIEAKQFFVQQAQLRLGGVRCLAFSSDGKTLACGGMSGFGSIGDGIGAPTVVLIDWETGQQKITLLPKEPARTFVTGVAFHPDGFVVAATGGLDRGYFLFWKPDVKESFVQFKLPESAWSMDMEPSGRRLLTAHHDSQLRLFELPNA